ncbi:MAG: alpha/beta fold hydrolase [Alicyclobacillus sp.]|nr:alpha/beta fold hydrolase [Alicyclobacillus sp.]
MENAVVLATERYRLAGTIHIPDGSHPNAGQRHPVVIICHGFIGNRIGVNRLFVRSARELANAGFIVVRFDYGGCGESPGDYGATTLDELISQTLAVIEDVASLPYVDSANITLLGHSLGGAVALLSANRHSSISSLVLWAPVANPLREITEITGSEVYHQALANGSADYLSYQLQSRFFSSLNAYRPLSEAGEFEGDVLILHGSLDHEISPENTFMFDKVFRMRLTGSCKKVIVENGDHVFSSDSVMREVISQTKSWLMKHTHAPHNLPS